MSRAELQRLKWFLWHGNVFRSLHTVDDLTMDLEDEDEDKKDKDEDAAAADKCQQDRLAKAVREFGG